MRSEFEEPNHVGQSEPETTPLPRMDAFRAWDFRPDAGWVPEFDLTGYHVEAVDGSVGKVRQSAYAMHGSYLAVDTGPWIFGRTVIIPAGIVASIDHGGHRIYLDRNREQVRSAPDFSEEPAYWDKLAAHYGRP